MNKLFLLFLVAFILIGLIVQPGCRVGGEEDNILTYVLSVVIKEGVQGTPENGTYNYGEDEYEDYEYSLKAGYSDLRVRLDGEEVAAAGRIIMDKNHTLTAETGASADYYVSNQGNDDNNGRSTGTAFRTIARALEVIQPGETIRILAGTYHETLILEEVGKAQAPVTLKGEEGLTILDGRRSMALGIWCEGCRNLIFEDLEIRNFTDIGIGAYRSSDTTMRNLRVHHNGFAVQLREWELEGYGIDVDECRDVAVEGNDVYRNGPDPQLDILMGTGINTYGCIDCIIRNNRSYENIGGGILVEDGINVLVEANEVFNNDLDASADEWWDGGLWVDGGHDIIIRNNTFRGNLGPGIEISDEEIRNPFGYILENNTSTGNYYGIYIWNFGTSAWPPDHILSHSGNDFSGNFRKDIWIVAWECPPDEQPCD